MPEPITAVVKDGDGSHELRMDACRVHLGGEQAGNIEIDIACAEALVPRVVNCVRLRVPGQPPSDVALGTGNHAQGIQIVFWSDGVAGLPALPQEVEVLWGEAPIASVAPTLAESVPIEGTIAFTEATEILTTLPVITANLVRLVANREKLWLFLVALLVVAGALVGLAAPGLELPDPLLNRMIGGLLLTTGLAVGVLLVGLPFQQLWLDRDRRRVLSIHGRTLRPETKLAGAPGRPLDDFDHVRIYMRWQIAQGVEEHDQEVWMVTLEGRIPFAGTDGTLHLHGDALPIGRYSSELTARKVAAEVAFHTGLKILDTGHDRTA